MGPSIPLIKADMPQMDAVQEAFKEILGNGRVTNFGRYLQQFEGEVGDYLGTRACCLSSATASLIMTLQALDIPRGSRIVIPSFTFVATAQAVLYAGCTPVFVDVANDGNADLDDLARVLRTTPNVGAVILVHMYGLPCRTDQVETIVKLEEARRNQKIPVLYDGAHAFGTEIDGKPVAEFGDATMYSFHATKLFHSAEGGGLAMADEAMKRRVDLLKNFGILNETEVIMPGTNGKMNEVQAALGLVNLAHYDAEHAARQRVAQVYLSRLDEIPGITCFRLPPNVGHSMQYFIVRVNPQACGVSRDQLYDTLKQFNVFSRRYFYPLCSEHNCYRALPSADPGRLPVATRVSREVLALPLYGELGEDGANRIVDIIQYICNGKQ